MNDTTRAVADEPRFPPEQVHMPAEVAARLAELRPGVVERAPEGDRTGRFCYEDMAAFREAGLMALGVPAEHGGLGLNSAQVNDVFREVAGWNSSTAQVLFVHTVGCRMVPLLASPEQTQRYFREVVEQGARFGVAASEPGRDVMDWRTRATRVEGGYVINGVKHFCTGTEDADYVYVYAILDTATDFADGLLTLMVPKGTEGMTLHGDWDAMGQRQTASGSITFEDCFVPDEHVLGEPGAQFRVRPSLWALYFQSAFCCLHTGMAEGGLEAALEYCRTMTRPWPSARVERAAQDPYIQRLAGELRARVAAARAMTDRANEALLLAERGLISRGEGAVRIAEAKAVTTEVALDVTSRMFEICGARASYNRYRMDRFWRSARTMTLHDPLQWKFQEIGNWALNGEYPPETFYS